VAVGELKIIHRLSWKESQQAAEDEGGGKLASEQSG